MKEIIGKRIRKIRESKDLSQENVAEDLGMTTSAYSKIERGVTDPSTTKLFKIAEVLKIDIREFFVDVKQKYAKAEDNIEKYGFATKSDIEELVKAIHEIVKDVSVLKSSMKTAAPAVKKIKRKK